MPLCEIVSEPDLRSAEEAAEYVRAIRTLVRYLGICDGNMEEGSLRCDANVSLRPRGATKYGTKTELKNMNSFKYVRDAIEHEITRQAALLDGGERVVQETRLWDAARGVTQSMRSKEQAHDYRYFPEPDLPPLVVDDARAGGAARAACPSCPRIASRATPAPAGLSPQDAGVLVAEREIADYFDATVAAARPPKRAANWVINEVLARVDDPRALGDADLPGAARRAGRAGRAGRGRDALRQARQGGLRARCGPSGARPAEIVAAEGLAQVSDSGALEAACQQRDRRPPGRGRALQGQPQADGLLRRRGHEGDRRQGQPQGGQRDPAQAARLTSEAAAPLNYAASSEDQISHVRRDRDRWKTVPRQRGGNPSRREARRCRAGTKVTFGPLLFADDGGSVKVGQPTVAGVKVEAEIVEQGRGEKLIVFKYKRRKSYRRKTGHRQPFTAVKITAIRAGA